MYIIFCLCKSCKQFSKALMKNHLISLCLDPGTVLIKLSLTIHITLVLTPEVIIKDVHGENGILHPHLYIDHTETIYCLIYYLVLQKTISAKWTKYLASTSCHLVTQ